MDKIYIDNLEIFAHHGVFEEETRNGQYFYVSLVLETNFDDAGENDQLELTTDYGSVSEYVSEFMTKNTYKLIETAAVRLGEGILINYPRVKKVSVEISKPQAPIPVKFENVAVKVEREWHKACLSIGSNIGDSKQILEEAIKSIDSLPECRVAKTSDFLITKPYGYTNQPDFLNGALLIETIFTPHKLLEELQKIELDAGRTREIHWGPRTLDLDIIFYEDYIINDENLSVPHPDMPNRQFVLKPLSQIAPGYVHPVLRKNVFNLLKELEDGK